MCHRLVHSLAHSFAHKCALTAYSVLLSVVCHVGCGCGAVQSRDVQNAWSITTGPWASSEREDDRPVLPRAAGQSAALPCICSASSLPCFCTVAQSAGALVFIETRIGGTAAWAAWTILGLFGVPFYDKQQGGTNLGLGAKPLQLQPRKQRLDLDCAALCYILPRQ